MAMPSIRCGHCDGRHESVAQVRECDAELRYLSEDDQWTESVARAEAACERYLEDRGYWAATAQEEYEMSLGLWP